MRAVECPKSDVVLQSGLPTLLTNHLEVELESELSNEGYVRCLTSPIIAAPLFPKPPRNVRLSGSDPLKFVSGLVTRNEIAFHRKQWTTTL